MERLDLSVRWAACAMVLSAFACLSSSDTVAVIAGDGGPADSLECSIPTSQIFRGSGRGHIPALTDPELTYPGNPGSEYVRNDDRVIGLYLNGSAVAVPLNILWWHEVVNLNVDTMQLAVTHCPLTGSSLIFNRASVGGVEFGVSGLLYLNNLMMYDRSSRESLWPQMARGARCGPLMGRDLATLPTLEITWEAWERMNPGTMVVSGATPYGFPYEFYPYHPYDELSNDDLHFPIAGGIDTRRPPKGACPRNSSPRRRHRLPLRRAWPGGPGGCCRDLPSWKTRRGLLGFQRRGCRGLRRRAGGVGLELHGARWTHRRRADREQMACGRRGSGGFARDEALASDP